MKVIVIDNYDSFVYNLVQYLGELGADPVVYRNDSDLEEIEAENPEAIVISPGPKTPGESGVSVDAVKELGEKVPILGVCLGHQAVAYAYGGGITSAKRLMHGKTSRIDHEERGLFEGLPSPFDATRYHSLVLDPESLPDWFRVTARTDDEHREIMAIEHEEHPVYGVQFHPESILTDHGMRMIENFLGTVRANE